MMIERSKLSDPRLTWSYQVDGVRRTLTRLDIETGARAVHLLLHEPGRIRTIEEVVLPHQWRTRLLPADWLPEVQDPRGRWHGPHYTLRRRVLPHA